MYGLCLQERLTLRGPQASTTAVAQGESCWLDLSGFQDVSAWIDVSEVTLGGATAVNVVLQTAATRDETLFVAMSTTAVTASGLTVVNIYKDQASQPLSRYVRWQIVPASSPSTSAWDISLRIFLAANAPGKNLSGAAAASQSRRIGGTTSKSTPMHKMPGSKPGPVPLDKRPSSGGPSTPMHRMGGGAPANQIPKSSGCSCHG